MESEKPLSTLRKQLLWSHLRIAAPAAAALCAVAISIHGLTGLLDRMQQENIPGVEAANLLQLGLQRSSAALRGWVALKQPELKVALGTAWSNEIDPALKTLMANGSKATTAEKSTTHTQIETKLNRLRDLHSWIVEVSAKPGNEPARLVLSTEFSPSKDRLIELFSASGISSAGEVKEIDQLRLRIATAELDAALGGFVVEANESALPSIEKALAHIQRLVGDRVKTLAAEAPNASAELSAELELIARLADSVVASRRSPRSNVAWATISTHAQPLADEIAGDLSRLAESETLAMHQNSAKIIGATDTLSVFASLAFLVLGLIALMLARSEAARISSPMVRLSRTAESVGQGNFSTPLPDSNTLEVQKLIESFQDMRSGISESYGSLRSMAYTDDLTGLSNRKAFSEALEEISEQRAISGEKCSAIALIDLDHFKQINDSAGHDAGDRILEVIAARVRSCVRQNDLAARLGGDEFALILRYVNGESEARQIAERLLQVASEPITYRNETIHPSATIGLVLVTEDACDAGELLKRADIALYEAKEINRGTFRLYSEITHQNVRRTRGLMETVAKYKPNEVFAVYYQPVVDLETREMVGVEALLRWQHPDFEVSSILEVIKLMERHGQMMRVSTWILDTALKTLSVTNQRSRQQLSMSVNISADLLHDESFVTMIQSALDKHNVSAHDLILEVTETMVLDEFETSLAAMDRLSALGVQFALDDFGTGYSSLIRLKEMPLARLKIDREFVVNMVDDNSDSAIVEASILLGRTIGMSVVAEGIETAEQAAHLHKLGCGYGQGYYFGRPEPQIRPALTVVDGAEQNRLHRSA